MAECRQADSICKDTGANGYIWVRISNIESPTYSFEIGQPGCDWLTYYSYCSNGYRPVGESRVRALQLLVTDRTGDSSEKDRFV